jgi:phage regulator Rha-like protein
MSSREIAELTGKQHKHVLADIRNMLKLLGMQPAEFSARYQDAKNESRECFNLPKHECTTLVSGYSIPLRHKITGRWLQLEEQVHPTALTLPDFTQPAVAARAWADQYERALLASKEVEKLTTESAAMVLIVVAFRRLCDAGGHAGHD